MALSLRQKQTDAVLRMLDLNSSPSSVQGAASAVSPTPESEVYKVLLLDRFCRDLISPLIKVNDLRKHGVTLHLLIDADRQPIPDVPAVYFVQATSKNIQLLIADASKGTYDRLFLNFSTSIPRNLLEDLAAATLRSNSLQHVARIFDQYLEFVCLDSSLFSLAQPHSYVRLNDPTAQDTDVEAAIEAIVSGLFCVLATLGVVPIIRCPQKGPAEMVGRQLDARLRAHLATPNNLFKEAAAGALAAGAAAAAAAAGGPSAGATVASATAAAAAATTSVFQRPLLCLFDRNFELAVGVQHEWTYRPLVHDVLGMHLNRVTMASSGPAGAAGKPASYELDESDSFWQAHCDSPFPKAAEEVDALLKKWTQDKEQVNQAPGEDAGAFDEEDEMVGRTKQLTAAMNAVPEMVARKKLIDKHIGLGGALLDAIKARALDAFFSVEEEVLIRGATDRAALQDLLLTKGTPEDKLRLACVYYLAVDSLPPGEAEAVEGALHELGVDTAALHYVKAVKRLNSSLAAAAAQSALKGGSKDDLLDWAGKLYGQSISRVTAGVKNLLSGGRQLALTRAVEALMDAKQSPETDGFLYLDPRAPKGAGASAASRGPVKDAVVFMIGGGNFMEYGGLQEMARRSQPAKSVVYGATEMLSGPQFLQQLAELGRKMGYTGASKNVAAKP